MSITVRECLKLPSLRNAEVLAGHAGLDQYVSTVSVLEYAKTFAMANPLFLGNEIILTAFISIKDDVDAQCEAIRRLHAVGEAAIVLYYVDYYMENVDQKLISVANELDFPLIVMPRNDYSLRYSDVITEVLMHIFRDQQNETRFATQLLQQISMMREQQRSISGILRLLSDRCQYTFLLVDEDGRDCGFAPWPMSINEEFRNSVYDHIDESDDFPVTFLWKDCNYVICKNSFATKIKSRFTLFSIMAAGTTEDTKLLQASEVLQSSYILMKGGLAMKSSALEITLKEFMAIAEIPRPSHHEEKIGAYLVKWAQKRGLTVEQDAIGDVIIDKPAAPGHERAPLVIIQAHMDMVCVAAEGVPFDPLKDPIKVINDGKTLRAKGTSLGADDGIGVALALYLLQDESLVHGPLRVILTVNEEDGMSSIAMPDKYLDGAYLINLDWEWLGSLCNSAAGGDFLSFTRKAEWVAPSADDHAVKITLKGLLGGHSGVGINLGRANALVCLATALSRIAEAGIPFKIADFHGGQAKNAIPAQAEAVITIPAGSKGQAKELLSAYKKDFAAAFGDIEHSYALTINDEKAPSQVLHPEIGRALISLLNTLPNNINTMSPFVTTLTESSQNLGFLKIDDQTITLEAMERSCVAYRAEEMLRASRLIAEAFGFTYTQGDHVPAWAVNPHSELVPLACEVYSELTGRNMVVEPVHGGLECGAFFEKNPDLDMIAIGPSLTDVHSPDESCDIESIRVTAELVIRILEKLA